MTNKIRAIFDDESDNQLISFATETLTKRNGIKLTDAEAARAHKLMDASNNYVPTSGSWTECQNRLNTLEKRTALSEANELAFAQRTFGDKFYITSRRIFGSDKLPDELQELVDRAEKITEGKLSHSAWNESEAKATTKQVYQDHIDTTNNERAEQYQRYRSNYSEEQSWSTEKTINQMSSTPRKLDAFSIIFYYRH